MLVVPLKSNCYDTNFEGCAVSGEKDRNPHVHNTPVLTSTTIDKMINATVFFKCENFQRMGAFKIRGATNAILQLPEEERSRGVITHSSGNFAAALALAARILDTKAYIVMPSNAPGVKKDAVAGYGAQIIECLPTLKSRESTTLIHQKKTGATFVHPSNDINVILGNSTAVWEMAKKVEHLDVVIAPVGGGGLIAGTALATNHLITISKPLVLSHLGPMMLTSP